jgi:hypothetical protein
MYFLNISSKQAVFEKGEGRRRGRGTAVST